MQNWKLAAGPLLATALGIGLWTAGYPAAIGWTASITLLTACWWILEPIPIPATSLIPIAVLPMVGVLEDDQVGAAYGNKLILLLLGGFMLSSAMAKSGAHRRIALNMVSWFGGSNGRSLVFGFMSASAALSMWISNMATTLMLLPIVMAILEKISDPKLRTALLLGVAYAASVGGVGTPVGTPPNLIFMENYRAATGTEPTFLEWMTWAVPVVVIMVPLVALWLTRGLSSVEPIKMPPVGQWRSEEVRTLMVFAVTAALWITRTAPWGGWSTWVDLPDASDASVALLAVVLMFIIPNGKGERLLDWETARKVPWGILLLFSAGMVIAEAFQSSGLSELLGSAMTGLDQLPPLVLIATVCLAITFMTEVTSNTATATLLMPILAAVASASQIEPKILMVPATISASFAFMLPAATGPNAVIFGSEQITVRDMAREGIVLNLVGVAVVTTVCYFMFG
jgi:sodium-dependent dicarboxylate transporter 2/3/5